ncbi:hypothetical protein LZ023_23665 [Pseudomonas silvicola]|nr:hypothetical protein LZ023_23665 [Pseudomonas silvicola]
MKAIIATVAVLSLWVVSNAALGADSDNTSGAPDATVMTQTHDSKAAGNKHGDATKGGRPAPQATTPRP